MAVEIAWAWLRYQPQSELSQWFLRRFAHGSKRVRKIGIVALARKLQLTALIEVHDKQELDRVLPIQPRLIGVNNRDLHTFTTDLGTSERLRPLVPADRTFVTESGIHTPADVARMRAADVGAFLVGEAFMRADDPGAALATPTPTSTRGRSTSSPCCS